MTEILETIKKIGIVPVVKIQKSEDILPMANSLNQGGINCMEITFRSAFAPEAIQAIRKAYPDMIIGAGTVTNIDQAQLAYDAGAQFIVTPGLNPEVVRWCLNHELPIIPGVQTASEIEAAMDLGLTTLKFFPAESSGGVRKLKDFSGPYSAIQFMPSGGINASNLHDYLDLPNVCAIGGSFMLPQDHIEKGDWDVIEDLSRQAILSMLDYSLIHLGFNNTNKEEAEKGAQFLSNLFGFKRYDKPKSTFSGVGFEFMHSEGRGQKGHFGIYTPYPERALYQLEKIGIHPIQETITRNKKSQAINFVYLDVEIAGFALHLINPDVKM